jgi:hypothetical protein
MIDFAVEPILWRKIEIIDQILLAEDLKTIIYRKGDTIGTTYPATLDISDESVRKYQWATEGDNLIYAPMADFKHGSRS